MATTIFQVSPYSSFSFMRDGFTFDDRYHTVPFDDRGDPTNYFQKIQQNDNNFRVQLLSDFTPTLRLYDCSDKFVKNISFTSRAILNASFLVYDAVVDYSDVDEGAYYLKLTYTDENDVLQTLRTCMLNVSEDWQGTLLLEYTNTYNDKGVVFVNDDNSLLTFGFRIEASFDEYQPLSADIDYTDQNFDNEVLNNTPYDNEKLYIGTDQLTGGAPDWAIKKMNLIFTLNKVSIDGQFYNKVEGSKFTPVRTDHGTLINGENVRPTYWSIDIIPNLNFDLQQLNTGDSPTGDLVVIKKAKIYDNVSTDFVASGLMTVNSNLVRIAVTNKDFDEFTILLGTTDGGDDIATIDIVNNPDTGTPDLTGSYDIGHVFNGATDIFVSGINGTNLKIVFDYNQYDAPALNPTNPSGNVPKGFVTIYEEIVTGDFALDWDLGTGLGQRNWTGWCLCGTNGTKDRKGKYSQAWDKTQPLTRGTETGATGNNIELSKPQLPNVGLYMFTNDINTTASDTPTSSSNVARARSVSGQPLNYEMVKGTPSVVPTLGLTEPMGAGDPISIAPDSWIDVWVIKITD